VVRFHLSEPLIKKKIIQKIVKGKEPLYHYFPLIFDYRIQKGKISQTN